MIRIIKNSKCPKILTTKGADQTKKDCDDYDAKRKLSKSKRSIYASTAVKQTLVRAHYSKCCYCEQKFTASRDLAVEHFRPKSGVKQTRGQKEMKPGYYWLAYDWNNLLLSCDECNSTYKDTLFPVATKYRARSHHGNINRERPLFVHPVLQDPRDHIRFHDDEPFHITEIGRVTIEEIGLRRSGLREAKLKLIKRLRFYCKVIIEAEKHPRSRRLQRLATGAKEFLREATLPDAEFSSMAQDLLSGWSI
jgi:uncharacterized protein (TIGR02646 family)